MKREELESCGVEVGADDKAHFVDGNDCYIKQEADSVMDAMERDYDSNRKLWEAEIASLKERVNELVDICEKNRVRRITDKERIRELEEKLAIRLDPALYPSCSDCNKCISPWIYCNESLPDRSGRYYVSQVNRKGVELVTTRRFYKKTNSWASGRYATKDNVYAWMSMKPAQKQNKESINVECN